MTPRATKYEFKFDSEGVKIHAGIWKNLHYVMAKAAGGERVYMAYECYWFALMVAYGMVERA